MANFNSRSSVQDGLDHLATRLSPIFTEKLADILQGLSWTVILSELDAKKGARKSDYYPGDLSAQLRLITERLGNLGYPFDDPHTRVVSTLGNELRIMRNRWAHNHHLSVRDASRTHDFVHRLLTYFEDDEGVAVAKEMRRLALSALFEEEGMVSDVLAIQKDDEGDNKTQLSLFDELKAQVQQQVDAVTDQDGLGPLVEDDGNGNDDIADESGDLKTDESDEDLVVPDEQVLHRLQPAQTPTIGDERSLFEPWVPVPVGNVSVLNDLPKKTAKEQVRAVANEITEFEGPIHVDRLAILIAASFGVERLHTRRKTQIIRQIRASGLQVDRDKFVWPRNLDRETWTEFRPNRSGIDRPFPQISPLEIANAARFLQETGAAKDKADLEVKTLRTFGRRNRTQQISAHLQKALGHVTPLTPQ